MSFNIFKLNQIAPKLASYLGFPLLNKGDKIKNIDFKYSDLPRFQVDNNGGDTRFGIESDRELECVGITRGYYNDKKLFIPTEKLRHERHYLLRGDFLLLHGFFTKEEYEAFQSPKEDKTEDEDNIYLKSLDLPSDEIFRAELDYPNEGIIDSRDLFLRKASSLPSEPRDKETEQSPLSFYEDIEGYLLRLRTEDYFSESVLKDRIANSDYWKIVRNNAA